MKLFNKLEAIVKVNKKTVIRFMKLTETPVSFYTHIEEIEKLGMEIENNRTYIKELSDTLKEQVGKIIEEESASESEMIELNIMISKFIDTFEKGKVSFKKVSEYMKQSSEKGWVHAPLPNLHVNEARWVCKEALMPTTPVVVLMLAAEYCT